MRILITGSRTWTDVSCIIEAITDVVRESGVSKEDTVIDDVEEYVQMSAGGEICHSFKSRRNSRGISYSLEIDHITQTASVSTGKISWEVPLSRVDNWRELA